MFEGPQPAQREPHPRGASIWTAPTSENVSRKRAKHPNTSGELSTQRTPRVLLLSSLAARLADGARTNVPSRANAANPSETQAPTDCFTGDGGECDGTAAMTHGELAGQAVHFRNCRDVWCTVMTRVPSWIRNGIARIGVGASTKAAVRLFLEKMGDASRPTTSSALLVGHSITRDWIEARSFRSQSSTNTTALSLAERPLQKKTPHAYAPTHGVSPKLNSSVQSCHSASCMS